MILIVMQRFHQLTTAPSMHSMGSTKMFVIHRTTWTWKLWIQNALPLHIYSKESENVLQLSLCIWLLISFSCLGKPWGNVADHIRARAKSFVHRRIYPIINSFSSSWKGHRLHLSPSALQACKLDILLPELQTLYLCNSALRSSMEMVCSLHITFASPTGIPWSTDPAAIRRLSIHSAIKLSVFEAWEYLRLTAQTRSWHPCQFSVKLAAMQPGCYGSCWDMQMHNVYSLILGHWF